MSDTPNRPTGEIDGGKVRTATMECQYCGKPVHFVWGVDMRKRVIATAPQTKKYELLCNFCYEFIIGQPYLTQPVDRALLKT